ncbi:MAG: hypothetical protein K8F91_03165 [Candidatus Obscuribacterales bacterium]|nr:hypothetical protein [Candidatus Obscuribacterales bacterium]
MAPAITLGIFAFLLSGAFLGQMVLHNNEASFFPALVIGIWAAWPFLHQARVQRYNFLHPVPREYKVPTKQAFAKVRDLLAETVYNFGDKWHISSADTISGKIAADLRFTDEQINYDMDSRGQIHTRKERLQRYLGLQMTIRDTGRDTTTITLDFSPKVEGAQFHACDSIVTGLIESIESRIGPGAQIADPTDTRLPAPPWWLLSLSALALFALLSDIQKAIFQ